MSFPINPPYPGLKFKTPTVERRFNLMHPRARLLAWEMGTYAWRMWGWEIVLTTTVSSVEEDTELERVSDTHRTGRAFDIRTEHVDPERVRKLGQVFRLKYPSLGAVDKANRNNLIVDKPHGSGPHLHVQIVRVYAVKITKEMLDGPSSETKQESGS